MTVTTRPVRSPAELREVMGESFEFSAQQFAAITAPLEPAVIIAGAGSGKTAVMAARVVWLVVTGQVRPEQILGLTFTTKAASELATRIRSALVRIGALRAQDRPLLEGEEETLEPTVATYNAYAASLLTEHGLRIGHEPDTRVVADASRFQLAARAVAHHRGSVEELSDHLPTAIGYLLALEGELNEHLVTADEVRRFHARELPAWAGAEPGPKGGRAGIDAVTKAMRGREELLGLVEDYRALKSRLGLMDFSDQIAGAARLAVECPEVGAAQRDRFRVVLLDEYQDTSVAQAQMLRGLFSGPTPDTGRGHAVMAVGDPNQAIYGWRGASVSNILGFGHDFPLPRSAGREPGVYALTVNRRSDVRILQTANELAGQLYAATRGSEPLEPKPGAEDGVVRAALLETYADELEFLAREVGAAHDAMARPAWSEIGVLTRDNAHAADVYDALVAAEIPVEIVGLNGLLRLPEVAEVVATLQLLHDVTANASLLTLLSGPRWAVGARDLALLGRRARRLAQGAGGAEAHRREDAEDTIEEELAAAVRATDPTDLVSLSEALDDPGDDDYSPEARERFAQLSAELRHLRGFVGEPLLDLVRRIIDTSGIDLELASTPSETAEARRENLDAFVKAVADFQGLEGEVSLPALLAYLDAEDEMGNGLDAATPSEANSVKLLTIHRAKGLEWDAVFLPGMCESKFPNTSGRTSWLKGPAVLPSPLRGDAEDLPQVTGRSEAAVKEYAESSRLHDQAEQLRLGYVAFTRARHTMVLSAHWWKPGRKSPLGPSPYLLAAVESMRSWGAVPETWAAQPEKGAQNPVLVDTTVRTWPVEPNPVEVARRRTAAAAVREHLADPVIRAGGLLEVDGLSEEERVRVAAWDDELERLLDEARGARAEVVEVPLPSSLSATALVRLREDPDRLAAELARPMPRKPSARARFGTRFHAWVEASFGQQQILDPDELPGRGDAEIDDDSDLRLLVERFRAGPFAERAPVAVEAPFALVLAGQVVRGRIDAVYTDADEFLVVDWKTGRTTEADPLQLAIYRVAWAELRGVPVERVRAAFYHVRTGTLEHPAGLPDRAGLEALVAARSAL
jgi:DNA helicase-2/ATP-dependent DNA helicase PcrA